MGLQTEKRDTKLQSVPFLRVKCENVENLELLMRPESIKKKVW